MTSKYIRSLALLLCAALLGCLLAACGGSASSLCRSIFRCARFGQRIRFRQQ